MNAENIIIVVILIIILIPALRSTIKHMKGEGACCGGPKEKPVRKKIDGKPVKTLIVGIEGMQCDNCKNRVERHLDDIDGVVAKVKLARKKAEVQLYKEVDEQLIVDTIEKLDFKVVSVETV
ncbi:MAG: heavy-metal-associated domain-containing protein [Eubacterium sp.]|nr:heavy-metal-associated domain-containing protein [Eubacterium sp.]